MVVKISLLPVPLVFIRMRQSLTLPDKTVRGSMRLRGWNRLLLGATLALAVPTSAKAEADCATEMASLLRTSSGVRVTVNMPKTLVAGRTLDVSWHADARAPLRTPVFIALAIDGEVRTIAPPQPPKGATVDSSVTPSLADLPGFLALSPAASGPLQFAFGMGRSRLLIPLHLPAPSSKAPSKSGFMRQGQRRLRLPSWRAPDVASACSRLSLREALWSHQASRKLGCRTHSTSKRQIVILASNSGRYRAHIYDDGRYRIYDIATGAKLVDRAGHDPNFSPTSRFVVANVGAKGSNDYELIDLVSREVTTTVHGSFIGWVHGDSFLIIGDGQWGSLTVRPALISRAVAKSETQKPASDGEADAAGEASDDGLGLQHPGSCHACASWTDDNLMLDLDNGILAFTGTFEPNASPVYELASGASQCCSTGAETQKAFIDKIYGSGAVRDAKRLACARSHSVQPDLRRSTLAAQRQRVRGSGMVQGRIPAARPAALASLHRSQEADHRACCRRHQHRGARRLAKPDGVTREPILKRPAYARAF